jgi:hypothetical protein
MNRKERRAALSRKGKPSRKILSGYNENGREVKIHATKGKRSYQLDTTNDKT